MAKRFERVERKWIHFTNRDAQVVQATFHARYLTNRHIARLFFGGTVSSSCKQRIRYLFDKGYLAKRPAYPNEPDIYFLGLKGRRFVAKTLGHPQEWVDKVAGVKGDGEAPFLMMRHDLTLSTLYVNALLECRTYGWSLEWKNARMLELEKLGVQPDAYLSIEGINRAYVEFTAVLPTATEMAGKLEGYAPLQERMNGVPILWLTTSKAKQEQIGRWVKDWLYHDYVLIGNIEEAGEFLTKAMWKWSGSEDLVWFAKRREVVLYEVEGRLSPTSQPVTPAAYPSA